MGLPAAMWTLSTAAASSSSSSAAAAGRGVLRWEDAASGKLSDLPHARGGASTAMWRYADQELLYLFGGCLFLPFTDLPAVFALDRTLLFLLVASGAATMISYYIFAVSLRHAESSRIGVVIALMPVFTVIGMGVFTSLWPGILEPERLEASTVAGALLVVAGVMLGALGSRSTAG